MENKYCIVVTYDSCDPMVYGVFKSENKAEKAERKIRTGFNDYDWRHLQSVTIRRIMEVK